jgi:hypothetical protein
MSGRGLKRNIDSECRVFNEKWSLDYLFIYSSNKIICLICKESIFVLKEYNIRRHYETKHMTIFSKFTGKLRLDKLQSLQNNFSSQQFLFKNKIILMKLLQRLVFVYHIYWQKEEKRFLIVIQ